MWSGQLRLAQFRVFLKDAEGDAGLETRQESEPSYRYERALYYATSVIILALFVVGLVIDYERIESGDWRAVYYGVVAITFLIVAGLFMAGSTLGKRTT